MISRPNPKHILLICGVVFLTYGRTLTHELTGDAQALFGRNTFYKDPHNLARLFKKDFIWSKAGAGDFGAAPPSFSGCISYRPVTALSFFIDQGVWQGRAFGFHLSNVLQHLANVILLYFLALMLTGSPATALTASLLFAVHPVQSEVVNSVGYRSDLLLTFFALSSTLCFLNRDRPGPFKRVFSWGTGLFFFLALFSKETAVVLPGLWLALEALGFCRRHQGGGRSLTQRGISYWPFALILYFYLYVYLRVFPSAHYPRFLDLGVPWPLQMQLIMVTLSFYLKSLALPFNVTVLPTLYSPPLTEGVLWSALVVAIAVIATVFAVIRLWKKQPVVTLGILWFWLAYLPASNILPLPNPLAYRFLYFPLAGLALAAAVALSSLLERLRPRMTLPPRLLIVFPLIGLLFVLTFSLNEYFQTTRTACREMVRNFPESSRPYWIMGLSSFDAGRPVQAETYFRQYLEKEERNPFVPSPRTNPILYHYLGLCRRSDPKTAARLFEKALEFDPLFMPARLGLTQTLILLGRHDAALGQARAAIAINPDLAIAYIYAAHSSIELGLYDNAQVFLHHAAQISPDDANYKYADQFLKQKRGR